LGAANGRMHSASACACVPMRCMPCPSAGNTTAAEQAYTTAASYVYVCGSIGLWASTNPLRKGQCEVLHPRRDAVGLAKGGASRWLLCQVLSCRLVFSPFMFPRHVPTTICHLQPPLPSPPSRLFVCHSYAKTMTEFAWLDNGSDSHFMIGYKGSQGDGGDPNSWPMLYNALWLRCSTSQAPLWACVGPGGARGCACSLSTFFRGVLFVEPLQLQYLPRHDPLPWSVTCFFFPPPPSPTRPNAYDTLTTCRLLGFEDLLPSSYLAQQQTWCVKFYECQAQMHATPLTLLHCDVV
jgi:hypothetical protein